MTRRRVEVEPGLVYETCDPEPTDPRSKEALVEIVQAAARRYAERCPHDGSVNLGHFDGTYGVVLCLDCGMQANCFVNPNGWELESEKDD